MNPLARLPPLARQINLFVLVGVTATITQVAVSLAAQRWLALGAVAASVAGYIASVGVSYFGNAVLTFQRPALHGPQFVRFAAISLTGLAVNLGTVALCTHSLGWPLWMALIPVVLVVPAATFTLSKLWAFRAGAEAA